MTAAAVDEFKKADKQDGGHCHPCQKQMIKYGAELGEWKDAELGAQEMIADAQGDKDIALAHYQLAIVLMNEGQQSMRAVTMKSPKPWPPPISPTRFSSMAACSPI